MPPSTVAAHRLARGKVDEMEPRAGGTSEGCKAPPLLCRLPLQMRLHVQARLRASKNDQISHWRQHDGAADFHFDLDQFCRRSRPIAPARIGHPRFRKKAKGPGPLRMSPAAMAVITIGTRAVIAWPVIPGAIVWPRPVISIVIRAPPALSPSVADHADLLDVGDLSCRRCRRDGHGRRRRRCSESTEQGRGDEANPGIHDVFLRLRKTGYRSCSDEIVAGPKCNTDEQIFSQSAPGLTFFSLARLSQVRTHHQCCICAAAAPWTSRCA